MKNLYSVSALLLLAVLFVSLTMLSGALLQGVRIDLTENRLHTLSPGTRDILASIEEPIRLRLYFSDASSRELPQLRSFATRVHELLEEMSLRAAGKLLVERIDPLPFSEAEDDAARFGLQSVPVGGSGDNLYLGVVGTNTLDGLQVLPFLSPSREPFLEYDLARMIAGLSRPDLPRVGLLSQLPMSGGFDPATRQPRPPWAVYSQLEELFEIEFIRPQADSLPEGLDVLVLVHPRDLSQDLLVDIDRFALEGGRMLVFVDPHAEADPGPDPNDPAAMFLSDRSSSLGPLFEAWGLQFSTDRFVADLARALQVNTQPGQPPVRHPAILGLTGGDMDRGDVVTAEIGSINLASAGALALAENSPLSIQPLLSSSADASLLETDRLRMLADPGELIAELGIAGDRRVLAARLSGQVASAFPERSEEGRPQSGAIQVIVVADTDLLSDRLWVQRQRFFGSDLLNPFAGNGAFVVNAVDDLMGDERLIGVRSRATTQRPFHLVDDLRREAESRLRETEQRLELELRETENRLTELQQSRGDADLSILTAEQEREIDRFMAQRLEIRKQLRQVRRELDRDIERLGAQVKFINIALVPLAVIGVALLLAWRRRRAQHAGVGL